MAVSLPPPYPRAPIGELANNPLPNQPPIVSVSKEWGIYFRDQRQYLAQLPVNVTNQAVMALDQNDAIGTTTIATPTQTGLYSFEFYLPILTADPVSSSAQVVLSWTDQTISKSQTFTAVTGNTITTHGSQRYLFGTDAGAPITYAVNYASNTPNAMHFSLYIVVQSVASVS